jgi:AcrR family transcriptional regulator
MQSSHPIPSAAPTHDPAETRSRLLDAAEQLFAEHGFNGVSMRTITGTAGVNLAAAHYHFQGKEGLYRAVFERRVVPMNEERARLLQACLDEEARTGQLDPSAVLDASADPSPEARRTIYELYDTVAARFVDILARACPHLAKEDLFWRLACIYGAMMYVRADSGRLQQLLGSEYSMADSSAAMHHIIPVLAAGLAVPSLAKSRGKGKRRSSRGS